ncbi:MAG: HEPN domain-containing protein [Candidatus Cloacimonetes bacterium]|nr:HEPN domain-containing protein [Candidatus Cloacimonadota bacterium]
MAIDREIFVNNYLEKSQETLIDVEVNINNDRLNNAQNRIYYAIFYSVMALGYSENFITSKHYPLMGWFNKKFIHEDKTFEKEMFKIYNNAYENRQKSDYSIFVKPDKENVIKSFEEAKEFIEKITSFVKENTKRS